MGGGMSSRAVIPSISVLLPKSLMARPIITPCLAYHLTILHMNAKAQKECCTDACLQLNILGVKQATQN
jgi:hypothetical protein